MFNHVRQIQYYLPKLSHLRPSIFPVVNLLLSYNLKDHVFTQPYSLIYHCSRSPFHLHKKWKVNPDLDEFYKISNLTEVMWPVMIAIWNVSRRLYCAGFHPNPLKTFTGIRWPNNSLTPHVKRLTWSNMQTINCNFHKNYPVITQINTVSMYAFPMLGYHASVKAFDHVVNSWYCTLPKSWVTIQVYVVNSK